MKKIIYITAIGIATTFSASANSVAEISTKALGAGIGYAIGKTQNDKAAAAGAVLGTLIADHQYKKRKEKTKATNLEYYLKGIKYQRWSDANKHWHTYTLDPNTGKPMAFSGLEFGNGAVTYNNAGKSTKNYYNTNKNKPTAVTKKTIHVPVIVSEGKHGGVNRTKRTLWFPRLP